MKKIIYLFLAVTLWSCSGDSETEVPFEPTVTSFNFEERMPQNMQTEAPIVYYQVMAMQGQMNAVGAFMTDTELLNNSVNYSRNNSDRSYGEFSVDYSYDLIGNKYQFIYTITYQDAVYYTIEGWQMADGSAGSWASTVDFDTLGMGMENIPVYTTEVSWSYHATGLHMEMSFDFGDTSQVFYEMSMSNDGSGDYTYTQNGDLTYSASWNANGTRQWTNHMTSPPIVTYW